MKETLYDSNPDLVLAMQKMGIRPDAVLRYVDEVLTRDEVRSLVHGLRQQLVEPVGALREVDQAAR